MHYNAIVNQYRSIQPLPISIQIYVLGIILTMLSKIIVFIYV